MQEEILKQKGLKITAKRKQILEILEVESEPMTADEIFLKARKSQELNFSTVYRTLATLVEKEIIQKHAGRDGKFYFQIQDNSHSHYLVCSECRKRIPVEGCPLEEIEEKLCKKTGFHLTGHNLEFIGECPDCFYKKSR